jgi:2-polyprenyl-3-methyl-5-hydroxy-6-metoxy-1,4-benzoquinol methylase
MCKNNSWSEQYKFRREAADRFGRIFSLPIVKRARDVLLDCVRDRARVLEVGAGDRRMCRLFAHDRADVEYRSLDIDPCGEHDYRAFTEIECRFDCVFAFEVIEHIAFDELFAWLQCVVQVLVPGGRLIVSTPNTYYPPAYLRDASHRTPLCYDELAALVSRAGLDVSRIVRVYNDPLHRMFLRRFAFGWLFRLIGIDFARQIVLVAVKPGGGD